ncbi:MAG: hypothetical protein ACYTBP_01460 [Planctomycetota bacterium]|jgi:hypothetical protein
MASIQFFCPNCNNLIAFESKYAGQKAHCQDCDQAFIIPSNDYEKPRKIKPAFEKADPVPGFYREVFINNWKLLSDSNNVTTIVFVIAVVCFKFFLGKGVCCMNYLTTVVGWGWLMGFYLNIISETAFDSDELPKIQLGDSLTFLVYIFKPIFVFFMTAFIVLLPLIITFSVMKDKGTFDPETLTSFTALPLIAKIFLILALFFFPMAILITATSRDYLLLWSPKCIIAPIFKTFFPYIIAVLLLSAFVLLQLAAKPYSYDEPFYITVLNLALNLAIQLIAIFTMRTIGLLYRHYYCNMPW